VSCTRFAAFANIPSTNRLMTPSSRTAAAALAASSERASNCDANDSAEERNESNTSSYCSGRRSEKHAKTQYFQRFSGQQREWHTNNETPNHIRPVVSNRCQPPTNKTGQPITRREAANPPSLQSFVIPCNNPPHQCIVEAMPGTASQHGNDLTALYDREHAPMLRVACLLVGERAIAEEIVHDAFATVSERWAQLDNPGGYLRTTVVNGCRMAMRRRATERRHAPTDAATVAAPTELIELRAALDQLRERERAVIVLRYFVDIPDAEIAQLLGCREATVRSTVHRALKTLRKELS
jgi:RNA polymerase sigma factor (sigma-70 family)